MIFLLYCGKIIINTVYFVVYIKIIYIKEVHK